MNAKSSHLHVVAPDPASSQPFELSDKLLRLAFDCAPAGVAVIEVDDGRLGTVLMANQELSRLLACSHAEVIGVRLEGLFDGIGAAATTTLEPLLEGAVELQHFEECLRRKDGTLGFLSIDARRVDCADDSRSLAVVTVRDATSIHDLAARFAFVADHDLLTSLLNRRGFETRLVQGLARSVRYGENGAVVVMDLDQLQTVNDTDGHTAGDTLLQSVADVLRRRLRGTDLIARIGGDEFALMIGRVDCESAEQTVENLLEQVRLRIENLAGSASKVTVTAGIAPFDSDHPTMVDQVIEAAEAAMHEAKRAGRVWMSAPELD